MLLESLRSDGALATARTLAVVALGIAVVANVCFVAGLMGTRPQVYGEAEVLFEAARMREHLPLYVDPLEGAFDYGAVPSRYYVCYPPLWSFVLSFVPSTIAPLVARIACSAAWLGALFGVARATVPRAEEKRAATVAAMYGAGAWVVANLVTSGRPDAIALAIVAYALVRTLRVGYVDACAGALFALAAWVKPNVFAIGLGAGLVTIASSPRRAFAMLWGVLAVSVPVACVLHRVSGGAWLVHFQRSLLQSLHYEDWWGRVWPRALYLLPALLALWVAWEDRASARGRLVLAAFVTAVSWTLVSLAKVGAAANYWAEPMLAAVAVFRVCPIPPIRARSLFAVSAVAHAFWAAAATTISVRDAFAVDGEHGALIERARGICRVASGGVLIADHPGPEQQVNGRIVSPSFQTEWLVLTGQLPAALVIDDIQRPEVRCLLSVSELDYAFFAPDVRAALSAKFVRVDEGGGWLLYRAR